MPNDNNHINNLGTYSSFAAAWAAHPEGGRSGDYLTIGTTEYYWDNVSRQWVPSSGGSSGGFSSLLAAVTALQSAVTALQSAVNGKADKGSDGRLAAGQAPRVVLESMGSTLNEGGTPNIHVGGIIYDEGTRTLKLCTAVGTYTDMGAPSYALIYCNEVTNKLYRWKRGDVPDWEQVANDVVNSLESNSTTVALSAYQGYILSRMIADVADQVANISIADVAGTRTLVDKMDFDSASNTSHGQYTGNDVTDDALFFDPTTKKLYYIKKVVNGSLISKPVSELTPDPHLIYWDKTADKVMRWDADEEDWIYSGYALASGVYSKAAMDTALALKANSSDVTDALALKADKTDLEDYYTKEQIIEAFEAAAEEDDVSGFVGAITDELDPDNDYHEGGSQQEGGGTE